MINKTEIDLSRHPIQDGVLSKLEMSIIGNSRRVCSPTIVINLLQKYEELKRTIPRAIESETE